jgi:hypothetical protein
VITMTEPTLGLIVVVTKGAVVTFNVTVFNSAKLSGFILNSLFIVLGL